MNTRLLLPLLVLSPFVQPFNARAQWQPDGTVVVSAASAQYAPTIVADGAGGVIVTWYDLRNGTNYDIYAQRIDAAGVVQWTPDGVAICKAVNNQIYPTIVSDGTGGAIVAWHDFRSGTNYDVYAQRIDAAGAVQWTADGVVLSAATNNQYYPTIASDGAGGAIVTWYDYRSGDPDIYAQRIDASGDVLWATDGVALCTAALGQTSPAIVSDGDGGAIVAWHDFRSGNVDLYAQRVTGAGDLKWTTDGVTLCSAAKEQGFLTLVADGFGGAIAAWHDYRSNTSYDIYTQRINADGAVQWTTDGVALCTDAKTQYLATIAPDGVGGAIVTWYDYRSGTDYDIYARRISAAGVAQWTGDGVALCTATGDQFNPTITSDGSGGAIVTWFDYRIGASDIYAQRIDEAGAVQWTPDGVALCAAATNQSNPVITSDGSGGAIAAWIDSRNGPLDIYALRIGAGGSIPTSVHGVPFPAAVALSANYPNPFTAGTAFDLTLGQEAAVNVEVFDAAGRRVRAIDMGRLKAGTKQLAFDGLDDRARALPSGVYFYRVHAGSETVTRKMVIAR